MDIDILTNNIHFTQKFALMIFLLLLSVYYIVKKKDFHKSQAENEEDYNILGEFSQKLMGLGSKLYILLFPLTLVFLEYTVSFYLFISILLSFYTVLFIVAAIMFIWKNAHKLWEHIEGWF